MKYLVLLAVIAVVYALWRSQRRPPPPPVQRPGGAPLQDMVACAHCGVHLPKDDALWKDGRGYCSRAHRDHR